jgi:hypothetical protein
MTLKYTLTQTRDRAVAALGTLGVPNDWWPSDYGRSWDENNDCIKAVLFWMGECTRSQQDTHFISIAGFRGWAGWNEYDSADIRPGDIALWNWSGGDIPEHAELVYSIDHVSQKITTISANTSPAPGVDMTAKNRGVYKKTRNITPSLLAGIRPPYKPATATITSASRARARLIGTYLNQHLPAGCSPSAVGDIGAKPGDGITDPAPIYWRNVQTWGRANGEYGTTFKIDGIPGARSRAVEAILYTKAKAAQR